MGHEMHFPEVNETNDERVKAMSAAISRAIGEVMQDYPGKPMAILIGLLDGGHFASVIGGGAHIEAPAFDRVLTQIAGDMCHMRGGNKYTGSVGYKDADECLRAETSDMERDDLEVSEKETEKPPTHWPFPTGNKH